MTTPPKKASKRWQLLRKLIVEGSVNAKDGLGKASVRRLSDDGAWFQKTPLARPSIDETAGKMIRSWDVFGVPITFRESSGTVNFSDIASSTSSDVDNTGNVCVWDAEELLAHYLNIVEPPLTRGKRVIELGAGMIGLAGLSTIVSAERAPASLLLTDGNAGCVANLQWILGENTQIFRDKTVMGTELLPPQLLIWSEEAINLPAADVVLLADGLFFERYHCGLLHSVAAIFEAAAQAECDGEGDFIAIQPQRGGSLHRFLALAATAQRFQLRVGSYQAPPTLLSCLPDACPLKEQLIARRTHPDYDADVHELLLCHLHYLRPTHSS